VWITSDGSGYVSDMKSRGRMIIVLLLAALATWGLVTVVNAVRLGQRDSDPAIYWTSVLIVAALTIGLAWLALRIYRRREQAD
jgi:peptidoglycan/LPS O-acetylase OafA/YrhL